MTGALTLAIRFPTGQYHAHDATGGAEWPPAPARVLTALLATAYMTRNPEAVAAVRCLFNLPPPTLWCPAVTPRDSDVSRWVPVDAHLAPGTAKIGRGGLTGKLLKPPERCTVVGTAVTLISWDAPVGPEVLALLDQLLPQVCYLGRPTSPVMMSRIDINELRPDLGAMTVWRPDPAGRERLSIATSDLLKALDQREQERELSNITGLHPRLTIRPHARYTRTGPPTSIPESFSAASAATVLRISAALAFYPTPRASPMDVLAVLDVLELSAHPDGLAIPIFGETIREGLSMPRLFGVAVAGILPESRTYLRGRELVDLPPPRPQTTTATAKRVIAATFGVAMAWTTLAPLPDDSAALLRAAKHLANAHSAEVVDTATHSVGLDKNSPDTSCYPGLTHLSVLFDRPIEGPLDILGVALLPMSVKPNE